MEVTGAAGACSGLCRCWEGAPGVSPVDRPSWVRCACVCSPPNRWLPQNLMMGAPDVCTICAGQRMGHRGAESGPEARRPVDALAAYPRCQWLKWEGC